MKCPTCDKEATWQDNPHRPFCSERCKLVDLGKWVNDEYRVPGREIPSEGKSENQPDGETNEEP
jgi:endogenous inhibitor of DNA gyrase (YacG/DUF329 family)